MKGRGFLEGCIVVNAVGCWGGVVIEWNEAIFDKVSTLSKLQWRGDGFKMGIVSVYSSAIRRKDLWSELAGVMDNLLMAAFANRMRF